jgi:hypothetical protein
MTKEKAAPDTPTVEVSISTSSETLDIMGDDSFKITMIFLLKSDRPITLNRKKASLFVFSSAVGPSGLCFINVENGEPAKRYQKLGNYCFGEDNREAIPAFYAVTLYSNKEYTVTHELGPWLEVQSPRIGEARHHIARRAWWGALGLESKRYEISVADGSGIEVWKYAPSWRNLWGWLTQLQCHPIPYQVKKTAVITVKQIENSAANSLCLQF